ncbi:RNA helicase NDAI_0J02620 [Naumovozyma dairenensis CBS 421]|uniref:RNA helicase n=1 Tax=Naumovozyma dairenensis (strain ATCC 10597 / BCRC 20456 / CBS 421 / NBRC 0211 / NRRL Y-12639) TaxID=1071378 RepID=G0WH76_NAUDC|nr:hypothetical protein NDAI_0J02620 [Naumovozyma dairenensis CBS 421]CCD27154.1 hypothetical protein NDAI_0J02620 [Naumovozyma dairenensis CBS 421]
MAKKNNKKSSSPAPKDSKDKKSKSKASSPAPVPETKDKKPKRGQRNDDPAFKANRAKVTSETNWTGKLPHTLLHENCQKRKWNKINYDMKKIGSKGFVAIPIISYTDPKTKETIDLKMNDPTLDKSIVTPQETPVEARHIAATVALFRIAYNTNLQMMLPPNHRNIWYSLVDFRKELLKDDPKKCNKLFDIDPFKTVVEERKLKAQKDKERDARLQQAEKIQNAPIVISNLSTDHTENKKHSSQKTNKVTKGHHEHKPQKRSLVRFPRKAWERAIFVDLDEKSRQLMENSIKISIDWNSKRVQEEKSIISKSLDHERKILKEKLIKLKFRPAHVEEAMCYKDPLSFLLLNLPEDDLPPFFHKRLEDSKNKVTISSLPLAKRMIIERLTESGVSEEEALFALDSAEMKENIAAGILTEDLFPKLKQNKDSIIVNEQESVELWNQEVESLESIYGNIIEILEPNNCYTIKLLEKSKLKLKVYRTENYPSTIPGIIISTFDKNYKLPNYIKKQILVKLLGYVYDTNLLGDMLIFHIYEWLQENLEAIIDNPGPLISDTELLESAKNHSNHTREQSSNKTNNDKSNNNKNKYSRTKDQVEEIKTAYDNRIQSQDYKNMIKVRSALPAWQMQNIIIDLVFRNDVVLITGETGSGKSTQVVQFLLDHLQKDLGDFKDTSIICTQPRRISAIGLADRVSDERCVSCGDEVGYVIRGMNKTNKNTRIKFMTTGVLVRILQSDKTLLKNCIVVIDEVHERSIDTDLVVTLLKNLLNKVPGLKIVLMSATVNVDLFKRFFPKLGTCHIEGRTFPIKDYFLDDILEELDFKIKREKLSSYEDEMSDSGTDDLYLKPGANSKFFREGKINYDLLAQTVIYVDRKLTREDNDGSIIIFLPGVAEINKCCDLIRPLDVANNFVVLPLHSALTPDDQKRVFKRYNSKRKIVVSTNIAETSITIDDCVATIDTGRAKTTYYNPRENTTKLIESFISKAESKQRRGRAGRVRNGLSFKLYSKQLYEETMISMPAPEIKRVALESLYLSVKAMGIRNVKQFLASGLDPPPLNALDKAERMLTTVGLLNTFDKSLSELGKFISLLPVMDSKHGKLLIYSIIFGCCDIGILLVSILSVGSSPFIGGMENRDRIKHLLSTYENRGDLLATAEIICQYLKLTDRNERGKFLRGHFLSYNKVSEILSSITQYTSILKDVGFLPWNYKVGSSSNLNRNENNISILTSILTGAFYPNVARVQLPEAKYLATSSGAIEKDPEARSIKYWIRSEEYQDKLNEMSESQEKEKLEVSSEMLPLPATRTFIHPSSVMFNSNTVNSEDVQFLTDSAEPALKKYSKNPILRTPFIVFNSSHMTTKLYLRDITPTSTLSLLLFGGPITYDVDGEIHSPGIVVDNWLPIRTWCKNGVLIKELRTLLDNAIKAILENPRYVEKSFDAGSTKETIDVLKIVERIVCIE